MAGDRFRNTSSASGSYMKKRIVFITPFVIFIPAILLLYVVTEISLDIGSQAKNREKLSQDLLPSLQDHTVTNRLRNINVQNVTSDSNMKSSPHAQTEAEEEDGDEGRVKDGERDGEGMLRNGSSGSNVTFPPFVDVVNDIGAYGQAVVVNVSELSAEDKVRFDEGWTHNSFNQYVSDLISVHRPLPHGWSSHCKNKTFRTDLPETSVIIIFHNEAWSILLRSVHSVLSRTPSHLLREVILVDDKSTMGHLKEPLDEYWRRTDRRVKVIHARERVGLTKARLLGYHASTAPMLVFLDSHIECFPGWFEPLADRIATNPNVTVYPSIEVINEQTLQVQPNHNVGVVGVFRWRDLTFTWGYPTHDQKATRTSPADSILSPTMPGGLFAIGHEFFTQIGAYDPGLLYWGGENIELSFKAWMCYGSVELVPCSHIGHIFRRSNPIKWTSNLGLTNVARVAHVWMDDYKNYFLEMNLYNVGDYGDISERVKLRKRMGCRDFQWFAHNVHPMPTRPMHVLHAGELKVRIHGQNRCIDSLGESSTVPEVHACHGAGRNQFWYITEDREVYQDEKKLCAKNTTVILDKDCQDKWNISITKQLIHEASGNCLQAGGDTPDQPARTLTLKPCDLNDVRQIWRTTERNKSLRFPSF